MKEQLLLWYGELCARWRQNQIAWPTCFHCHEPRSLHLSDGTMRCSSSSLSERYLPADHQERKKLEATVEHLEAILAIQGWK